MGLSGEEKKLQALFSELKGTDEQTAPHFARVWNRAQIAPRRIRVFNPAFVTIALLFVFGVAAFAVWSRYWPTKTSPQAVIATAPQHPRPATGTEASPAPPLETAAPKPKNAAIVSRRNKASQRNAMLAAADRKLQNDAKSISNWQSPTTSLLTSPSDEILNSVPELNQNATQLKSFLPNR